MTFSDPLPAMVKKARSDATLAALIPVSRIHEGFMPDEPDINGIYAHSGRSPLRQIVSSGNQSAHIMTGSGRWQVDALSKESMAKATQLARTFCEAIMPSITTAGLYVINYEERSSNWDQGYMCFRSTFRVSCPYREWITI